MTIDPTLVADFRKAFDDPSIQPYLIALWATIAVCLGLLVMIAGGFVSELRYRRRARKHSSRTASA